MIYYLNMSVSCPYKRFPAKYVGSTNTTPRSGSTIPFLDISSLLPKYNVTHAFDDVFL